MCDDRDPENEFMALLPHLPRVSRPMCSSAARRTRAEDYFQSWLVGRCDRVNVVRFFFIPYHAFFHTSSSIHLCASHFSSPGSHCLRSAFPPFSKACVSSRQRPTPLHHFLSHILHEGTHTDIRKRSSSILSFLLLGCTCDCFLFFIQCFFSDARRLGAAQLVRFSVKTSLLPGNVIQRITLASSTMGCLSEDH
jgi:hypothetical protein